MPAVRSRARLAISGLICLLVAAGLSLLTAAPAQAAPPNIIGPANGVTVPQIPNLVWVREQDVARYDVQVSTSDSFATRLVDTNTVNSQYSPTVQLPMVDLWWRVRVTGSGDAGWATAQFTRGAVPAPTMLGPSGVLPQPDSPPLISWTAVPGAVQYNLQVSSDQEFIDPSKIINFTPTRTTSGINPALAVPNTYYARVKADLGGGISTAYSQPTSYTIEGLDSAERLSPPENGVVTDTVLDWKPVPGAATYQMQIDDDNTFASPVVNQTGITGTRFAPPKTIGNDTYYWRVRPIDASGNARAWTDADRATFQRAWPGQVHLEHPADGATVGDPFYFQWSPSERTSGTQEDLALSSSYTLEVSTSSTFQGAVLRCNTVGTTWVPQLSGTCWPNASGTYYWRVIGHDDFSSNRPATDQPSAEVRTFTYSPDVPELVSPTEGDHVTIPTLSWNPVPGAARYRVSISPPSGSPIVDITASTSYTPRDMLDPGTHSWQVQTLSVDGRLGTSFVFDTGSFVVDPMPAAVGSTPDPLNSPSGRRFPTLKWSPVVGATSYEVWVKPVANAAYTMIPDDFFYPAGESLDGAFLDPGDYHWFVKAFSNSGALISGGDVGTFTINPLEVIPDDQQYAALAGTLLPDNPEDAAADLDADTCRTQILSASNQSECDSLRNTPVLRWADKPNVGSYLLYVARDKEMTNPVYDTNQDGVFTPIVLSQPMWTPSAALPDSQAGTAYYYRVVPCSYQKCEALSHAQHSFDKLSRKAVLQPARYTPVDGSAPVECPVDAGAPFHPVCQNDVTLSWQDYRTTQKSGDTGTPLQAPGRTEARSYVVQTATDPNFQNLVETTEVDQTTFTSYLTTYPEGPIYWRVQAVDGSANQLAWSDTGVFDKRSPAPVLLSPDGTQPVRGDLFFSWASLPFAAQYRVEVYKNHDTDANAVNLAFPAATVRSRMVSLTAPLAQLPSMPNGDDPYVWRVRRIDAANRNGAWSDWGHFKVVEPTTNLTSPPDSASVPPSDALFTWSAVTGAETYRFERRLVGTTTIVEPVTTRALSWAPQLAIPGGSWEWRVTPVNASAQSMTPSPWRPFSVEDTVTATTAVAISGSGRVGTPLTVTTPPSWNFGGAVTTTYQWFRGAAAIGGEVGQSYIMTSADLGKSITVKATGKRPGYVTGTSTSNAITGLSGNAPVAVTDVSVSGTGKVGTNLTATPPAWDNDAVTTTYQWQRDGVNITGATTTTYAVVAADVGKSLTLKAMGARTGYDQGLSESDPVTGVLGDAPVATTDVSITSPSIKVGTTVTLSPPTWGAAGVTTSYQWFRDATAIAGATATTYKLAAADIGASVTVRATGAKPGYQSGSSTSNAIVAEQLDTLTATAPPSITGVAAARETLTANPGTWPSGTTFTYQWFVDGLAVAKEVRNTYVVRTRDAGLPIYVRVTASKTGYLPGGDSSPAVTTAKLVTKTTASLKSATIAKRARGVVLVKIDVLDLGVPLGKVQIKDGSKVIGTVTLRSDSGGALTIRLKKLLPGKHKLKVFYLGSTATTASKSKKLILTVLKK